MIKDRCNQVRRASSRRTQEMFSFISLAAGCAGCKKKEEGRRFGLLAKYLLWMESEVPGNKKEEEEEK
jgi:hypothetical protein